MTRLSSSLTFVLKFFPPFVGLVILLVPLSDVMRGNGIGRENIIPFAAGLLLLCCGWWLKRVSMNNDVFIISNFVRTVRVPVSTLTGIREHRASRTKTITLKFSPPTPFGRRVVIVPPIGAYDDVAKMLRPLVKPEIQAQRKRP
jgi:hypothetical protein